MDVKFRRFNQQRYKFELRLYNDYYDYILNPNDVQKLVLEDDMHFWPIQGYFIYNNNYEIVERQFGDLSDNVTVKINVDTKHFKFRNDGNDFLDITIKQLFDTNDKTTTETKYPDEVWEIKYTCVIYDKEDLISSNVSNKSKKYYFIDKDFQKMTEIIPYWSTATTPYNLQTDNKPAIFDLDDNQRSMYTGDAIKAILKDHGFITDDSIENFNSGITKLLYTTNKDKNLWDCINYLYELHLANNKSTGVDENFDIAILNKERWNHKFQLIPLQDYFKFAGNSATNPGKNQVAHAFFKDPIGMTEESPIKKFKAPLIQSFDVERDIKTAEIISYNYVDMNTITNTDYAVTSPVHTYDFKNKTFATYLKDTNILKNLDHINNNYIKNKLYIDNGGPLLQLNENKITNKSINSMYSTYKDKAFAIRKGFGNILNNILFTNQCMDFNVIGLTIFQSGKFIGIDRMGKSDNDFDYKVCGQWFMTKVTHIFENENYNVNIRCVKMHTFKDISMKINV